MKTTAFSEGSILLFQKMPFSKKNWQKMRSEKACQKIRKIKYFKKKLEQFFKNAILLKI